MNRKREKKETEEKEESNVSVFIAEMKRKKWHDALRRKKIE